VQKALQITFKGTQNSPALETLIRQRVDAVERLHPRITGCRVVVEIPYLGADSAKVPVGVTVEVDIPAHKTIVGKDAQQRHEVKDDRTASVHNAFDAVERQLARIAEMQDQPVNRTEKAPHRGMVIRLFPEQNYGFVESDNSSELYFTRNAVIGGSFDDLEIGMVVHVTRAVDEGPMGPQAHSVKLLDKAKTPE
jgi:cold shock CspA family protein/ribosome-associated translation inhibitor RaiA